MLQRKSNHKQIHIIAGPNGAGKTSHSRITLLPDFLSTNEFVNADEIAKILSPKNPEGSALSAGKLMLNRIKFLISKNQSFALETTLSARIYLDLIKKAQDKGYKINLIFLRLASYSLAQERVAIRVSKGGHNIENKTIKRRFQRGLANLKDYLKIVDTATIYEASNLNLVEIANKNDNKITIIEKDLWKIIYA
jgi:predicted ABC-type ATPase